MRPPLHRWCWTEYLNKKTSSATPGDYQLRERVAQPGKQLIAFDADVVLGPLQGWLPVPFAPTPKARQAAGSGLKVGTVHTTCAEMNQMLAESIYKGPSPDDLVPLAWVARYLRARSGAGNRNRARARQVPSAGSSNPASGIMDRSTPPAQRVDASFPMKWNSPATICLRTSSPTVCGVHTPPLGSRNLLSALDRIRLISSSIVLRDSQLGGFGSFDECLS